MILLVSACSGQKKGDNYNMPLGGRSFSIRPFRKARSSLCASRVVSILVCLLCVCHCIRSTNPKITRVMVIKSPNIHWIVSKRLFISDLRSSIRLLRPLSKLSIRLSIFFCPSSSLVSLSTISLSLILGALSTAISKEGVNMPRINQIMIMTFFMFSIYHFKTHNVNPKGIHPIIPYLSSLFSHPFILIIPDSEGIPAFRQPSVPKELIHPSLLFIPFLPSPVSILREANHPFP